MPQIRFDTMQGFEEYPIPKVLVRNWRHGGREEWFDWFGSSIHIDDYERNRYCRPILDSEGIPQRYTLSARTDEMSEVMIACFGTDVLRLSSLDMVKNRLCRMLHKMNYTRRFYEKYEIVLCQVGLN